MIVKTNRWNKWISGVVLAVMSATAWAQSTPPIPMKVDFAGVSYDYNGHNRKLVILSDELHRTLNNMKSDLMKEGKLEEICD